MAAKRRWRAKTVHHAIFDVADDATIARRCRHYVADSFTISSLIIDYQAMMAMFSGVDAHAAVRG